MRKSTICSIACEYGFSWVACKALYATKMVMLRTFPIAEKLFERHAGVKRVDVFDDVLGFREVQRFLRNMPEAQQRSLIEAADKAAEGIVYAFSSIELNYGNPIEWMRNPQNGEYIDGCLKWFCIPDFDKRTGDIKLFWEVSRFTQFILLARAALLTNDIKYYKAFSEQLSGWLEANPYSYGPNYKCGQECALRMINALMAFSCFKFLGMVNDLDEACLQDLVSRSYRRIRANFFYANKCIRNNHTLSELCGMMLGAWCCKDERATKYYYTKLDTEFSRQFLQDGGYIQWSFNYQRFALQLAEMVIAVSKKTKITLSEGCLQRLLKSAELLYQMQSNDGTLPNYGNNDGALIFPLTSCEFRDYRPTLDCLFKQIEGHTPYEKGIWTEESAWFGILQDKHTVEWVKRASSDYQYAGLHSLRHGAILAMTVLQNFEKHRPAHMDQLHLDVTYRDKNVLCDSGSYSYADALGDELARTKAHNTLVVNESDQMYKKGPFLLFGWTDCLASNHSPNSYKGAYCTKTGYKHERAVEFTCDKIMKVTDTLETGQSIPEFEIVFHTPFETAVERNVVTISSQGDALINLCFDPNNLTGVVIEECVHSPLYLKASPAKRIVARYSVSGASAVLATTIEFLG